MIKVDSTSKTIFEGIGKMIDAMVTDYGKFNSSHNTNDTVRNDMFEEYKNVQNGDIQIKSQLVDFVNQKISEDSAIKANQKNIENILKRINSGNSLIKISSNNKKMIDLNE